MAINKMDWQKNLLIAAMLAVLLMLVIRWHQFEEQHTPAATPVASAQIPNSEIPAAGGDAGASDVPAAVISSGQPAEPQAAVGQQIQVKTDKLEVTIDLLGGDIVRVALPQHFAELNTPDQPFVLLDVRDGHTYIAQSGLIGTNGTDIKGRPTFTATQTSYQLKDGDTELNVDLHLVQDDGAQITKRFHFSRGHYLIGVEYLIDNQSSQPWTGQLYGQIKRDSQNFVKVSRMQMNPYLGAAITTNDTNYKKVTFKEIADKKVEDLTNPSKGLKKEGGWVAMVQHYFISAWIPDQKSTNTYHMRKLGDKDLYLLDFVSPAVTLAPGTQGKLEASFYAGPKDTANLEKISPHLDLTVDYGWLWWVAKPLFWVMKHIHGFVSNWGLAIIGLTLLVKAIFFPLSAASYKSMAKMRKLQPKMTELKERYGEDRQKFSQEMMKLYKNEKVNPFGGCLPLLIQMPVFLALYWVLAESVELRHAPFFGWITDLSIKDPYFVLPVIYGITMWVMQKLNPQPTDPMQARVMQMLPLMFTFMFLWFPAGLVLYWVTNNSLSILQQYIITKQIEGSDSKA